jgi:hypothetical protein
VAEDISTLEVEHLDEAAAAQAFGRALSPKQRVRERVDDANDGPHVLRPAPGLVIVCDVTVEAATQVAREALRGATVQTAVLCEGGRPMSGGHGAPIEWLSDRLERGSTVCVVAAVDIREVREALDRVFASWPVEGALVDVDPSTVEVRLADDRPYAIDIDGVARRAALTAVAPEEAAHLELDRVALVGAGLLADDDLEAEPTP